MRPLAEHIAKGLYGAFIVDPADGREDAEEMVMVMNGFDTNFDRANEMYAANSIPFAYMREPIQVARDTLVRIYLVNVLEYDLINSFHLHGNLFHYYPTGTSKTPSELTDTVMLCQGQRGILEWKFAHPGPFMFHAHQSEFTELGWQGFFEVTLMEGRAATVSELRSMPAWLLGLIPLVLIMGALGAFALLDGPGLGDRRGPPAEELAVERTRLTPGVIELTVRNDGPDEVSIAQAVVNDAFVQFSGAEQPIGRLETATVRVQQPWVEGEAYEVALMTSTGGTFAHEIPVAVETPANDLSFFGLMALLGVYVGVIPIALGMLWLPWVRRIPPSWLRVVMALTVGLLGFLAIDATLEGFELAGEGSQAFGGAALVLLGGVISFLLLSGVSAWIAARRSGRDRRHAGAAGGGRHRAAQPRRGRGHRLRLLGRRPGAGRVPGRRLRAAQHDRGAGHRGADRAPAADARPAGGARPDRRRAGRARRLDRRRGVQRLAGRLPVRLRRRRDRAGDRPARAVDARRRRPHAAPGGRRRPARRHRPDVRDRAPGERMTGSSEAVENYAKAIYSLQHRGGGDPVATNDIADRLEVTAASASGMIKKLADLGLVAHVPYRGVQLTDEGERLALEVLRHHRLLELYLATQLDVPWDRVHEEAEALEHVLSEDLEARIAAKLGNPTHDPHGDPIPSAELVIDESSTRSLSDLAPGDRGVFVRVSDSDPAMLRYLSERGVCLGDRLEVLDRQPFGGPLTVRFGDTLQVLGGALAAAMRVELDA